MKHGWFFPGGKFQPEKFRLTQPGRAAGGRSSWEGNQQQVSALPAEAKGPHVWFKTFFFFFFPNFFLKNF